MYSQQEVATKFGERAVGQLPISVATSLALEGAFGIHPDQPPVDPAPIMQYNHLWINVRTMVRNILGAITKDFYEKFEPHFIHECIHQEMQHIEGAVLSASNGGCSVVFYSPDYGKIKQALPGANYRVPGTEKQFFAEALERVCTTTAVEESQGVDMRSTKIKIEAPTHEALILTHLPIDLLSRYNFRKLDLLESHTGVIKDPAQWYSKLTNGRELPPLPFNEFTLKVFGDNNNLLSAQPIKVRRAILEVAAQDKWTAITTRDKILASLRKIEDKEIRAAAQALMS